MLFPDGHLLSRRWLPVAIIGGLGALGVALLGALADTLVAGDNPSFKIANPMGIEDLAAPWNLTVFVVLEILFTVGVCGAAASVMVRLRRSRGVECRQLEWFAYVIALFFGGAMLTGIASDVSAVGWLGNVSFVTSMTGLVCLPIAVGIAVLRHHLYDIDIIINRTVVYGSLTLMLLLVYLGGVTATQADFQTLTGKQQQPQLVVVISTLAIAALLNPLRRRIQSFIDRAFSGASTTRGRPWKRSLPSCATGLIWSHSTPSWYPWSGRRCSPSKFGSGCFPARPGTAPGKGGHARPTAVLHSLATLRYLVMGTEAWQAAVPWAAPTNSEKWEAFRICRQDTGLVRKMTRPGIRGRPSAPSVRRGGCRRQ